MRSPGSPAVAAVVGIALAAAASAVEPAPSGRQLFQLALHLEEVVGDIDAALKTYDQVAATPDVDPPLAARAEYRVARLLSKVGRVEEARARHRQILARYSGDPDLVELLRASRAAVGDEVDPAPNDRRGSSLVARRLLESPHAHPRGAISPDGKFLVFVDWVSGNLIRYDLADGTKHPLIKDRLGNGQDAYACSTVVSPEGARVAYTWFSDDATHQVRVASFDGGATKVLLTADRSHHLQLEDWSRDGRSLLGLRFSKPSLWQMVLISTADGDVRVIRERSGTPPTRLSLSPDGASVVYAVPDRGDSGEHDVYWTAADGTAAGALIEHPANDLFPIWTPDGGHVLFASDRTGTLGAWMVSLTPEGRSAQPPRLIKPDIGRSIPLGFTHDGALIYGQQTGMSDVFFVDLDLAAATVTGAPQPLQQRYVGANSSPVFSADGGRLAYISERGPVPSRFRSQVLVVRSMESGRQWEVAPDLKHFYVPRWLASDALVLFGVDRAGRSGLYRVDAEGGETTPFSIWPAEACACITAPAVTPDGSAVAYFRPTAGAEISDLVVRHQDTGTEQVLVDGVVEGSLTQLRISPDSQRVAVKARRSRAEGGAVSLMVHSLGGEAAREALRTEGTGTVLDLVGWTPTGDGLVFSRMRDGVLALATVPVAGGDATELAWGREPPEGMRDLELHPGGHQIVFTAGRFRAEIWMLENLLAELRAVTE